MQKSGQFSSVRLVAAGLASLLLLAAVGFGAEGYSSIYLELEQRPVGLLATTVIALLILVTLGPVLWRGRWRDRWLALLLCVFPMAVFAETALRLGGWLVHTARV